jgi:predicted nucleotidyltransferase|tara:strand:- start:2631 stop:2873 length:243 start_codon:yes stop_codon:yes gene_type:complete
MNGSVTITLEDYHTFLEASVKTKEARERLVKTAKELGVFLSYLASRENIKNHVEAFNVQSTTSKIQFDGTKAIISLREDL